MDDFFNDILEKTSLYDVLGVSSKASQADLRKAYLQRSMQCHPDKSDHPKATEAFQRVAEAYDILSDIGKRREYDLSSGSGFREYSSTSVHVMSAEEAFTMFSEAMAQYAQDQGIEFERRDTVFDTLASGLLFVDNWLNRSGERGFLGEENTQNSSDAGNSRSNHPNQEQEPGTESISRLQWWARSLNTMGSIVSTASQIVIAERERERAREAAARR
mmetsp:Transcript_10076/g.17720  ORF Transcript_10076/g.17720 Transcript_10076/m.17720 type:complete len:217 (-) Transcript_10076:112-762(-)